eukprot:1160714-Pelagomonas_calceolata.AAC.20
MDALPSLQQPSGGVLAGRDPPGCHERCIVCPPASCNFFLVKMQPSKQESCTVHGSVGLSSTDGQLRLSLLAHGVHLWLHRMRALKVPTHVPRLMSRGHVHTGVYLQRLQAPAEW